MISIGNDIVALRSINKQRTNDSRFHLKFITPNELALHQGLIPFKRFVWLLWSVKESAYKYRQRVDPQLIFSPTKIVIQNINIPAAHPVKVLVTQTWQGNAADDGFYYGELITDDQKLFFRSIICDDFIATVVSHDLYFKNIYWGVQSINAPDQETQSRSVRAFLLNKLKAIFPEGSLSLQKSPAGYPVLLINENDSGILISLAHHNIFTSYSFVLPV